LRIPRLIRAMKMGFRVALVSDAGTPTISDPGFRLTAAAHDEGIAVEALPGPCAVTTALSASGFPSETFSFMGYLPKTESDKADILLKAASIG
jgi:16S rRNA (cytidine1402-2'-O)-methyltransferase